jgi:hypothetical protein
MVANTVTASERFVAPPEPVVTGRWRLFRLTRQDAEVLVRMGRVPEDATTELLDGMIVLKDRSARDEDPTMIGKDHRICVGRLSNLPTTVNNEARHVESQQPLVCSETQVPEPDFMVLRGTLDSYRDLPMAADAYCVVEVADSSYDRDAGIKLFGYARAGVVQYIIINLRNRTAEVYTNPNSSAGTYPPAQVIPAEGTLQLRVGETDTLALPLNGLLP